VARFLHEAGGKVIAIADRKGATHNEKGLDIPRLTAHMARGGSLTDFEGGGPCFSGPNFLTLPCDVLVPAALGGVITAPIAQRLQCKVGNASPGEGGACRRVQHLVGLCHTVASLYMFKESANVSSHVCLACRARL
jgi:hypothetical protein